ncbi:MULTISPECIES: ATP-binding cassette domain-containing protein [unclassified Leptotrichia]|jgi:ABC transporter related|uniref:ATP-binding cassette domain-containing protein n=1 Tax=unclassified Leptotrichia TaxID=2633022 RepID=UPI0018121B39|nr:MULTISPECIES: ATP-binding cassette domain-containing protein [unclassified Leptotrichia]MBB1534028.1 ABC transporter ATP-binding protein [Leptotrichia sp.]QUB97755.1 ABC transporter ATP-binding protein [Leptotrichia sp. oral taxon 221]
MSFLEVKNLKVHYPIRGGFFNKIIDYVYAVDGVDMLIEKGKSYGLVGESGSGKSTIGKAIIGLEKIRSGKIFYEGKEINHKKMRDKNLNYSKDIQMIFQDSLSSLNPKKRIIEIITEPLKNFENLSYEEEKRRASELLEIVGLSDDSLYKYPHEFSGGQRQRIGIARSVATKPKLIIADEPVSALDLSVQAQVLNYMKEIQKQFGMSYLFISHDLGVIKHMCDEIFIMYKGRFVEKGLKKDIYGNPQHIYTKRLIAAIPEVNPRNRKEKKLNRLAIEKEYKENESNYYDENGRVYDLKSLSETHFVALDGKKKGAK